MNWRGQGVQTYLPLGRLPITNLETGICGGRVARVAHNVSMRARPHRFKVKMKLMKSSLFVKSAPVWRRNNNSEVTCAAWGVKKLSYLRRWKWRFTSLGSHSVSSSLLRWLSSHTSAWRGPASLHVHRILSDGKIITGTTQTVTRCPFWV